MARKREEADAKLHKAFVPLIRPVERARERAAHLDEMDEAEPALDRSVEALFDNPESA